MAAEDIGANFSNYQGNAGLAGGNFGVIELDTKPLDLLSAYTFTVNKVKYDQAQKDAEANAKKLADLTAYDLNTAIPKDREIIQKGYDELYNFVRDNPTVLDYKNNQKGWMEYNKKKNDFENKLQGAKTRSILYTVRDKEATDATSVAEKQRLKEALDKEANSTDITTPLRHTELFDVKPIEVTAPPTQDFDVTQEGANIIAVRKYTVPDMASVDAQAQAKALGFETVSKDPNSAEYKAQSASGKLEPVESSANITAVLQDAKYQQPQFRNPDGTLNLDLVIKDNSGNGLVRGVLTSVKEYNEKMQEYKKSINSGYFQDKFKSPIRFGAGGLDEGHYSEIDISDGIQPQELLKIRILGKAPAVSYNTKITETNDQIEKDNLAAEWYKAKTGRINATRPSGEGGGKQEPLLQQPALIFGEHVNRLKKALDKQGGGDFKINYEGTDEITRSALGLQKGKYVVYKADGTAFVNADKNGVGGVPLTIEEQKNNFILAVKGGSKDEAMLDAKFLGDAETGFQAIFGGITSGTQIWNGWGGTKPSTTATGAKPTSDDSKLSDAQYFIKYKKSRK